MGRSACLVCWFCVLLKKKLTVMKFAFALFLTLAFVSIHAAPAKDDKSAELKKEIKKEEANDRIELKQEEKEMEDIAKKNEKELLKEISENKKELEKLEKKM